MRRQLGPALRMVTLVTVVLGLLYPLAVTGIAQGLFSSKANGSLVHDAFGHVVGSSLIGQGFTGAQYFHPRPSAAGDGYDGTASAASNLGPSSSTLAADVGQRVAQYRRENDLAPGTQVPVDAVTTSGSGLDPEISIANARLQAPRVARARGLPLATVLRLVAEHTEHRSLGFLGGQGVNVLELNLALNRTH